MELRDALIELKNSLFDFTKRNPLVDAKPNKIWWWKKEGGHKALAEKMYLKAAYYRKEYGLETTLEVTSFIKWKLPTKNGEVDWLVSPLIYYPTKIKRRRGVTTEYSAERVEDAFIINPIIEYYFLHNFDFTFNKDLPSAEDAIQALLKHMHIAISNGKEIQITTEFNTVNEWQIINKSGIGNFNYKKSTLNADFDVLIAAPNDSLKRLFGDSPNLQPTVSTTIKTICALNASQKHAVTEAVQSDYVIQGPPGTGKSHTIVGLIGSLLSEGKRVLFVSEKRAALEVVMERLTAVNLNYLTAYFNTEKNQKKHFYTQLKSTWEFFNENKNSFNHPDITGLKEDVVYDFYKRKFLEANLDKDENIQELLNVILAGGYQLQELSAFGKVPASMSWKAHYEWLRKFESDILSVFNQNALASCTFVNFNAIVFKEKDVIHSLEKRLNDLKKTLTGINQVQEEFDLNCDFDAFVRLAVTASVLNMVDKSQMNLLSEEDKKYKSFSNAAKKYQLLKAKLKQAVAANKKWTQKPSMSEITELMDLLTKSDAIKKGSVFKFLRRNPVKLVSAFKDFHSGIGVHTKIELLESLKHEYRLNSELEALKIKLFHNLNIKDPDNEIDLIFNLRNRLDAVSQNEYVQVLEHQKAPRLIAALSKIHPQLVQFSSQKRYLFEDSELDSLKGFELKLTALQESLPSINHWLPEFKSYFNLPSSIRNFISANSFKVERLNSIVAYQNLLNETKFEPGFKQLSGTALEQGLAAINTTVAQLQKQVIEGILKAVKTKQALAENQLGSPSFKLKLAEKLAKKTYKNNKRLILHELGKQQRHLSVRNLLEETKEHLMKLQPLWVMNPLTVSENLPCEADLFDVVIFDEASQIPLEDALPAIYRAKQTIVVGDDKQMPPSRFFSSKTEVKTLLNQAEITFKNSMLQWHYRSQHPALIQFSNSSFYEENLLTLPPRILNNPIILNKVKSVYSEGKNILEAVALAAYTSQLLTNFKNRILIIAFSQEQEKELNRQLKKVGLTDHQQLEIRSLENVQGTEAEIVLISMGYGFNSDGEFRLNLGPVNQQKGANRLNVLFTRAIEKMVFFTNVSASDFPLSENKGITVLRDFIKYAEELNEALEKEKPTILAHQIVAELITNDAVYYRSAGNGIGFSSFINYSTNELLLVDPGVGDKESNDIVGNYQILKSQYKTVKIILTADLWLNKEKVKRTLKEMNFC